MNANDPNVLKQGGAWKGIKNFKAGLMIAVIIGVYLIFVLPVMLLATLQVVFNVSFFLLLSFLYLTENILTVYVLSNSTYEMERFIDTFFYG